MPETIVVGNGGSGMGIGELPMALLPLLCCSGEASDTGEAATEGMALAATTLPLTARRGGPVTRLALPPLLEDAVGVPNAAATPSDALDN